VVCTVTKPVHGNKKTIKYQLTTAHIRHVFVNSQTAESVSKYEFFYGAAYQKVTVLCS